MESAFLTERELNTYPIPQNLLNALLKVGLTTKLQILNFKPTQLAKEINVTNREALSILTILKASEGLINRNELSQLSQANQSQLQASQSQSSNYFLNYSSLIPSSSQSALEILKEKVTLNPIFTLCEQLDNLLGGGVQPKEITEICGVPGIGKTQLAIQIAVDVTIPAIFGGLQGHSIYIDTEGSFIAQRALSMAQGLIAHLKTIAKNKTNLTQPEKDAIDSMTVESILSSIHLIRAYDHNQQLATINQIPHFITKFPKVKCIIIDSAAFHFRRSFDDYKQRNRLLQTMGRDLIKAANQFNLAILVINQVTTNFSKILNNDKDNDAAHSTFIAALGETWSHVATSRVMLSWQGSHRMATLVKSPSRKPDSIYYIITKQGVRDYNTDANESTAEQEYLEEPKPSELEGQFEYTESGAIEEVHVNQINQIMDSNDKHLPPPVSVAASVDSIPSNPSLIPYDQIHSHTSNEHFTNDYNNNHENNTFTNANSNFLDLDDPHKKRIFHENSEQTPVTSVSNSTISKKLKP